MQHAAQLTLLCGVAAAGLLSAGCGEEAPPPAKRSAPPAVEKAVTTNRAVRSREKSPPPVLSPVAPAAFSRAVSSARSPVCAFFHAPESAPCTWIRPRIEAVAAEYTDRVAWVSVDLSAPHGRTIELEHGIRGVPTFVFIKDGEEIDRIVGLPSRERLRYSITQRLLK